MGLTIGKYFIKIIFDIKIEIGIFEVSNVPIFNKFWALLILGPTIFDQTIFDIKIKIGIPEILDMPNFNKPWEFLILKPFWA